jgi:hypothetical protein
MTPLSEIETKYGPTKLELTDIPPVRVTLVIGL